VAATDDAIAAWGEEDGALVSISAPTLGLNSPLQQFAAVVNRPRSDEPVSRFLVRQPESSTLGTRGRELQLRVPWNCNVPHDPS